MRFQFRLKTLILVALVLALICGWYVDHKRLVKRFEDGERTNARLHVENDWLKMQIREVIAFVAEDGINITISEEPPADWYPETDLLSESAQTCTRCQSTRFGRSGNWTIDYKSPAFGACEHRWKVGVSSGVDDPVGKDVVVLLRKGDQYGAFTLTAQNQSAETVTYKWYYRSDGQGTFAATDEYVQTGTASGPPIAFGPFSVGWSIHTSDSGWLYYDKMPGDKNSSDDLRICVTDQTDISKIDARDPTLIYKVSIIDAGIPGGSIGHDTSRPHGK